MDVNRVPRNLQGLFNFCMRAGDDYSSTAEPMDPERANWLREALESMTVDLVQEMRNQIRIIIEQISTTSDIANEVLCQSMEYLIELTEDMNLADIFLKIGGLELLVSLFRLPRSSLYSKTGYLLCNIVQNHEIAQKVAINNGLLEMSLNCLLDEDADNMRGIFSGVSALVRGCCLAQEQFINLNGFNVIFDMVDRITKDAELRETHSRLINKANFFLLAMCEELQDNQILAIKGIPLVDRICELSLRVQPPSEYLLKGILLLISGRVSSLISSPDEKANPTKFPLQSSLKHAQLSVLESLKLNSDSSIDVELITKLIQLLI